MSKQYCWAVVDKKGKIMGMALVPEIANMALEEFKTYYKQNFKIIKYELKEVK